MRALFIAAVILLALLAVVKFVGSRKIRKARRIRPKPIERQHQTAVLDQATTEIKNRQEDEQESSSKPALDLADITKGESLKEPELPKKTKTFPINKYNPLVDWDRFQSSCEKEFENLISYMYVNNYKSGETPFAPLEIRRSIQTVEAPAGYKLGDEDAYFYIVKAFANVKVKEWWSLYEHDKEFDYYERVDSGELDPYEQSVECFKYGITKFEDIFTRDKTNYTEIVFKEKLTGAEASHAEKWFSIVTEREFKDLDFRWLTPRPDFIIDQLGLLKIRRNVTGTKEKGRKIFGASEAFESDLTKEELVSVAETAIEKTRIYLTNKESNEKELQSLFIAIEILQAAIRAREYKINRSYRESSGKREWTEKVMMTKDNPAEFFAIGAEIYCGYTLRKEVEIRKSIGWEFAKKYGLDRFLSEDFRSQAIESAKHKL